MRFIAAFVISCAIIAAGAVAFAYSGLFDVAATSPHGGVVAWFASTTSDNSIERRAQHVQVPVISGADRVVEGAGEYDEECVACHGAPGRKAGPVGRGLEPDPPDLSHSARELSAAELFWVIKHGIKMTGMPAWGITHKDDVMWSIVAFINEMPEMTASRYQQLVDEAHSREMDRQPAQTGEPAPSGPPSGAAENPDQTESGSPQNPGVQGSSGS